MTASAVYNGLTGQYEYIIGTVSEGGSTGVIGKICETYQEMLDLSNPQNVGIVWVKDATGDPTVSVGSALYGWNNKAGKWEKITESESSDIQIKLSYNDIIGRPKSSATQIDDAVKAVGTLQTQMALKANQSTVDALSTRVDEVEQKIEEGVGKPPVFENPDGFDATAGTIIAVGGLAAGTVIHGQELVEVVQQMTFPYVKPSFSSFNAAGLSTQLEVGATLNPSGGKVTFSWGISNANNVEADTPVILTNASTGAELWRGTKANTSCSVDVAAITKNAEGNNIFRISTTSKKGEAISRDFTTNWVWKYFYMVDETLEAAPTADQIADGSYIDSDTLRTFNSGWNPKAGTKITLNITAGKARLLFAYPSSVRAIQSVAAASMNGQDVKNIFISGITPPTIEGATAEAVTAYRVYVYQPDVAFTKSDTYTVTI